MQVDPGSSSFNYDIRDQTELKSAAAIYLLKPTDQLLKYHTAINEAAFELCKVNPALLIDRKKLSEMAANKVNQDGYVYKRKKSRSCKYTPHEPQQKRPCLSNKVRSERMEELNEELTEIRLHTELLQLQRKKHANVEHFTKAIDCTNKMESLRVKAKGKQLELAKLQKAVNRATREKVLRKQKNEKKQVKARNQKETVDNEPSTSSDTGSRSNEEIVKVHVVDNESGTSSNTGSKPNEEIVMVHVVDNESGTSSNTGSRPNEEIVTVHVVDNESGTSSNTGSRPNEEIVTVHVVDNESGTSSGMSYDTGSGTNEDNDWEGSDCSSVYSVVSSSPQRSVDMSDNAIPMPDMNALHNMTTTEDADQDFSVSPRALTESQNVLRRYINTRKHGLCDKSEYKINDHLYVSKMDYTLEEACSLNRQWCSSTHKSNCTLCKGLIGIGMEVLQNGMVALADVYRKFFPHTKYVSNKAIRHVMSMSVVVMKLDKLYILAKENGIDYTKLQMGMQLLKPKSVTQNFSKETLRAVCQMASTEKDAMLIKYAACKAAGKGAKKAKADFGFNDFTQKDALVKESLQQLYEIKNAIEFLSKTEDAAVLASFGIIPEDEDVETGADDDDDDDAIWISEEEESDEETEFPEIQSDSEDELVVEEQRLFRSKLTSLDDRCKALLQKRRQYVKRKAARKILKEKTKHCILKRKVPKRVSRIVQKFPTIGKDMEDFVRSKQFGADAWRRTGVTTFDHGCRRAGSKVTFGKIKQHLEKKYNTKIAYGTVVQLCVVKNSRKISAKRYKGVARVTCKRARKGFNVKYNPDAHWNTALYRNLDFVQLSTGENRVIINRDDQAGFRLDTTFTHNQRKSVSLESQPTLTTRTDFVNTYPSIIQTSSYLFMETETTPPTCVAVVKPHFVFNKNPAQHAADLHMLTRADDMRINQPIECIRVDGASDEGPSHIEVQFQWAERHLQHKTQCTLVTTRHSGGSYLNRVELMNGCIAQAHANCFIPSTLGGGNFNENGLDEEKLRENLDEACSVYMERIWNAPCMGTELRVVKGSQNEVAREYQSRRGDLLVYLKGSKKSKEELKARNPERYRYFDLVWDVKERHMLKNLPCHYIFGLHVCYQQDCPHPICSSQSTCQPLQWYPGGPAVNYVPLPVPDTSTWGSEECSKCKEDGKPVCHGHYMGPCETVEHNRNGGLGEVRVPPSQVLKDFFSDKKEREISHEEMELLGKQLLLPVDEVKIYLDHLKFIHLRRQAGARKAAETRRRRRNPPAPEDLPNDPLDNQPAPAPEDLPNDPLDNQPAVAPVVENVQGNELCCWCKEPPSERMLHCSNASCAIGDFHYACLGILHPPPDMDWFCRDCQGTESICCCGAPQNSPDQTPSGISESLIGLFFHKILKSVCEEKGVVFSVRSENLWSGQSGSGSIDIRSGGKLTQVMTRN